MRRRSTSWAATPTTRGCSPRCSATAKVVTTSTRSRACSRGRSPFPAAAGNVISLPDGEKGERPHPLMFAVRSVILACRQAQGTDVYPTTATGLVAAASQHRYARQDEGRRREDRGDHLL